MSVAVGVDGSEEGMPTLSFCLTAHTFSERLGPFEQEEVTRRGVPTKEPPRLVLGLSRPPAVLVPPGPPWAAGPTRGVGNGLFGGVEDVRREELGSFFNV